MKGHMMPVKDEHEAMAYPPEKMYLCVQRSCFSKQYPVSSNYDLVMSNETSNYVHLCYYKGV